MLDDVMLHSWRYLTKQDPAYKVVILASVANLRLRVCYDNYEPYLADACRW
jgi:hypothetical protein